MVLSDHVEQVLWDQIRSWLHDSDALVDELMAGSPAARMNDLQKEMATIDHELGRLNKGQRNVLKSIATGLVDLDDTTLANLTRFKTQKEKLCQRKNELVQVIMNEEERRLKIDDIRSVACETLDRLDDLEFTEKKAIVRALVTQVVVSGRPPAGRATAVSP
jgi:site-specific DNA recombinase